MTSDHVSSGNVVSMSPARARVLFRALGKVEAYWEGLRNGRAMPARAEVDPRGIADVLEFAFILESVAPGIARYRLAGMHLSDLMAMEVRGMPISAMFLPEARRELQTVIEQVLDTPAAVRLILGSDKGLTRPALDGQMILLPLRDAHGRASRVLGALETRGRIGRGPRRFMIRDVETKALGQDLLSRPRAEFDGFQRLPDPRPVLTPVTAGVDAGADGFAPATGALTRRTAEPQGHGKPGIGPHMASELRHLRLVHDADQI